MALSIVRCFLCNIFCVIICSSLLISSSNGNSETCFVGSDTEGYTLPHGDIVIEYGNELKIECIINTPKHAISNVSSQMQFQINNETAPLDKIRIINETVIEFNDPYPPKSTSNYVCVRNGSAICMNKVAVAVKPQNVTDFKCIGYNFDNLTCTWTEPNNEIKTDYSLTYKFKGRNARDIKCQNLTLREGQYSCFWNDATEPQYRPAQSMYYFTLHMNNSLGHNEMKYTFDHYANILAGPPENLTCLNVTTNSIFINWSIPQDMIPFPRDVQHRLLYQCEYGPKEWKFAGTFTLPTNKKCLFNITGIPYAHSLCDIRVSVRSALAKSEEMWSKNASINVRTMSTIPGAAPKTVIGSFEIRDVPGDKRDAYIYWQQIPDSIKNGEDFLYNIAMIGNNRGVFSEITSSFAKYTNLEESQEYRFKIWSSNSVGNSTDVSFVDIPGQKIKEPSSFTKTSFGNGIYELSWNSPVSGGNYNYTNYTLFWCVSNMPFQCKGHLNWTMVPIGTTAYNITVDELQSTQFAISANSDKGSSGMVWATCTLIHNHSIGKLKTLWINNVGSDFIEVGWKLDCSDRIMSVVGYIIYYCPILSLREATCTGPEKNQSVHGDSTWVHGRISNLTPYTTYMLKVAVKSKHSISQPSDPLFNVTLEAAPSAPTNVTIIDVSNSSITIEWYKPKPTNGVIKYYLIQYNNQSVNITPPATDKIQFELKDLNSYVRYFISVKACTISCSESSRVVERITNVGTPDSPVQPSVGFQNVSLIEVKWEKPKNPRGRIDMYDVQFKKKVQYSNETVTMENITDRRFVIDDCGEGGNYESFYVSVRAVNIWNGARIVSDWSPELEYYCRTSSKYLIWLIIPILIGVVVVIFYCSKRVYLCCKEMRNVDIKLPPGLNPNAPDHNWSLQKGQDEIPHHSPGDEEYLLVKMNGISSGDSSGCSSGHESVSSSIESGKNSSSSDSGTEQPRSSISTDDVRQDTCLSNGTAKPVQVGYVTMPTDNYASGNYCVLGVNPNPEMDSDNSYVPVNNILSENTKLPYHDDELAAKSTPYVLTGDLTKPNFQRVPEKNPAYVMAGNKDVLLPAAISNFNLTDKDKSMYVQVTDCNDLKTKPIPGALSWATDKYDSVDKGYVSVGDIPAQVKSNTGYVPHRHFDATTLKNE